MSQILRFSQIVISIFYTLTPVLTEEKLWFTTLTPGLIDFTIEIPLAAITLVETKSKVTNPRSKKNPKEKIYGKYVLIEYVNESDDADGIALQVSNNKEWAEEIQR